MLCDAQPAGAGAALFWKCWVLRLMGLSVEGNNSLVSKVLID